MKLLIIYFLVLGFICIRDLFKVKNFDDYVVAGRKQSSPFVFMSLMATVLGASATVGIAARAESIGFAAFWWLGVGAIGFWFQAAFLSKPVHDLDVRTLPEIAEKTVGKTGRKLVAFIIAISWIGIIAAQFAAVAGFIGLVLGHDAGTQSVLITAVIVIVYTLLGGQLSVVRTDALQFGILTLGFFAAAIYLFGGFSGAESAAIANETAAIANGTAAHSAIATTSAGLATFSDFSLLNEKFSFADLALMLFTVGGAYFLGPDVISRNLVAKDSTSARKAVVIGSFAILVFSVVIVLLIRRTFVCTAFVSRHMSHQLRSHFRERHSEYAPHFRSPPARCRHRHHRDLPCAPGQRYHRAFDDGLFCLYAGNCRPTRRCDYHP